MQKLIIKHKGQVFLELDLKEDVEYSIGRGEDNHVKLPAEGGVSRRHLTLTAEGDGSWLVKNLSKVSPLLVEGEEKESASFSEGGSFRILDFEFFVEKKKSAPAALDGEEKSAKDPAKDPAKDSAEESANESPPPVSPDGATQVMNPDEHSHEKLSAFLKIFHEDGQGVLDVFSLEDGSEWEAGRDPACDIPIDSDGASRRHFKIKEESGSYFIMDLKSANGTYLNDQELSPGKLYLLESGDSVYILDTEIVFEIKNLALEKKLMSLKAPVVKPSAESELSPIESAGPPVQNVSWSSTPLPADQPGAVMEQGEESWYQKNRKRVLIYGSAALVLAFAFFFNHTQKSQKKAVEQAKNLQPANEYGLSPKDLEKVKNIYEQARALYAEGQFEYCKSEIRKIYKYTESYEQSKKLEITCTQAAENRRRQHSIEQQKLKAEETDKMIGEIAGKCDKRFTEFVVKSDLMSCLQKAIELAPADTRIQTLIDRFQMIEIAKQEKAKRRQKRRKFIESIRKKYNHAKSLYKQGKVLKSITAYENFIKISQHKELAQQREQAQRELASIKKDFYDNIENLKKDCEQKYSAGSWREAYYICEQAGKKIPSSLNQSVLSLRDKARGQLEVQMKPLYEEASINESVGNVAVAKDYWNKILNKDVKTGLYYGRAKEKLGKY